MILVPEEDRHVNLVLPMADLQDLHMGLNPAAVAMVPLLADLMALEIGLHPVAVASVPRLADLQALVALLVDLEALLVL